MQIPKAADAIVPAEKLTGYLLSRTHPVGSAKARFFRSLGFDDSSVATLAEGFRRIAQQGDARQIVTPFGTKYVVSGELATPRGVRVQVETVWIIELNETRPRFVTAYPLRS